MTKGHMTTCNEHMTTCLNYNIVGKCPTHERHVLVLWYY
jgi:hypothetical protein